MMSALAIDNAFARFWSAYPKRNGSNPKAPARAKFVRHLNNGVEAEAMIAGAMLYAKDLADAKKAGTEFVAMATTWLNQKRWEDYEHKSASAPPTDKVFIEVDSPQWKAWCERRSWPQNDFRIDGRYRRGWFFPTEWPQGALP